MLDYKWTVEKLSFRRKASVQPHMSEVINLVLKAG